MSSDAVGTEKPFVSEPEPDRNQLLLGRFSAVWVWTAFLGLNAALTASYGNLLTILLGSRFYEMSVRGLGTQMKAGVSVEFLELAQPIFSVAGVLATLAAWGYLYVYFSSYVLPTVMMLEEGRRDERRRKVAARAIRRVYLLTIVATAIRFLPELFMALHPLLVRLGLDNVNSAF
jgi:hypothetical protein